MTGFAAEKGERGFFYQGFVPIENPFEKPGTHHWVAPNGSDANAGTKESPWQTLDHARASIQGGDIVVEFDGELIAAALQ